MFCTFRFLHRPPAVLVHAAIFATFVAGAIRFPSPARAQGTHLWLQSQMEEFEKGTPEGVAIQS
ncbi:MAG: hypothetical protein WBC92_03850, partial [Terracidiphilus sp.]